jgi:hypothetical protein
MRLSFAGSLAVRAVGCVLISDNKLVSELRECRVGSTESLLGFSHEDAIPVYCIGVTENVDKIAGPKVMPTIFSPFEIVT